MEIAITTFEAAVLHPALKFTADLEKHLQTITQTFISNSYGIRIEPNNTLTPTSKRKIERVSNNFNPDHFCLQLIRLKEREKDLLKHNRKCMNPQHSSFQSQSFPCCHRFDSS